MVAVLMETFGLTPLIATIVTLALALIGLLAVFWLIQSAPPRTLTVTSGPAGSSFQRFAESYEKALAKHGVTLKVLPSGGSQENLQRLQSAKSGVDIGFVQSGIAEGTNLNDLVSLGSVSYQPLWVFYRSATKITRLSELTGKRIAIGQVGSGTHALALTLLQTNGITGAPTTLVDSDAEAAAAALREGKLDAVFLMGDSAPIQTLRTLIREPEVQIFNFTQADAYVRRYAYLNKIDLPQGSIDFGKNLPAQNIQIIGPTVELVARESLNSALSDLLLEVAQEVHGKSSLLQKRGEFPAPIEHEIAISEDATRYYKSGKGLLYRSVRSFWLASLINRILVAIVPIALIIIPAVRFLPLAYRWSIQLKIYRCYRPLLLLEREALAPVTPANGPELLRRLDEIEEAVRQLKVPASFADQFYALKGHIVFVRQRLKSAAQPA